MSELMQVRLARGVSKAALCRYLDVAWQTYTNWENNPDSMRLADAKRIAQFLHISPADIFLESNCNYIADGKETSNESNTKRATLSS